MPEPSTRRLLPSLCAGLLVALWTPGPALAQPSSARPATAATAEAPAPAKATDPGADAARQAWDAASEALRRGPAEVRLNELSHVALPKGYGFIPPAEGRRLMEAMGNRTDTNFLGLILPVDREEADPAEWLVALEYVNDGHIADDDARDWDADDLLKSLKEGTEEGNAFRTGKGMAAMEVTDWVEPPAYDAARHRLVWSVAARDKGAAAPNNINYNTYVLGREGYVSLNMITDPSHVATDKAEARTLLAATAFDPGKTYADYDATTDRLAEYGLATLVGGVVLKKAGVLALLGALAAKFFKVLVVAVLGLLAGLKKFFGGRTAARDDGDDGAGPGGSPPASTSAPASALSPSPGSGVNLAKD